MVQEQIPNSTCNSFSSSFTVQCYTAPPTVNANNGNILSTDTYIGGFSGYPGATVNLYRGAAPGTLVGTTVVDAAGSWSVNGLTLVAGQTYYATQNSGCNSIASNAVTIVAPTPVCPQISGSYTESSPAISGTLPASFTGTLRLYRNGAILKSASFTNATTWTFPVNTDNLTLTDKLSPGDSLFTTAQWSGGGENSSCGYIIVSCDMPQTPAVAQSAITITQGQSASFAITNSSSKYLYSLLDNSNLNYSTSVFGNDGVQTLTTYPFNSPGNYNLKIAANNLGSLACRQITNVSITVNSNSLPLRFQSFAVKSLDGVHKLLTWTVSQEQNINQYVVERSFDGLSFEPVGTRMLQPTAEATKQYQYEDVLMASRKFVCYRVKAVEANGSMLYTKVVSLFTGEVTRLLVAPNPAASEAVLYMDSENAQVVKLELVDMTGRPVLQKHVGVSEGRNAIALNGLDKLARGNYFIKLIAGDKANYIKLLLK